MKRFCKRILTLIVCFLFVLTSKVNAATGARHYIDDQDNVFLGGNYIEVGISMHGVFGTTQAPKKEWGFHFKDGKDSRGAYLGLLSDGDGWDTGKEPITGDFFTPGSPEERWILAYSIDGVKKEFIGVRSGISSSQWKTIPSVEDTSSDNTLRAKVYGVTIDNVELDITYEFDEDAFEYNTIVDIKNNSGKKLTNVRFLRSFDPDQDVWTKGTNNTFNKVTSNPVSTKEGGPENFAMVVARGEATDAGVFFLSFDNRARVSRGVDFAPGSAYLAGLWDSAPVTTNTFTTADDVALNISNYSSKPNGYKLEDSAIAINTNFGDIEDGASDTTSFITSLDPDVERSLSSVTGASGNAEMDRIVIDAENGQYYALFDGDTLVKPWTNKANDHGQIIFDGLTPGKTYIVKTVTEDQFNTTTNKPADDAEVAESEMKTLFDPTDTTEEETTISSTRTKINLDGLNDDYTYALVDEHGVTVKDFVSPEDGKVTFDGLTKDTKYYLVSMNDVGEKSGKVEVKTMNNFVELSVKKEGEKAPDSKIASSAAEVFDIVLTQEEKDSPDDINVYLTVKNINDEISDENKAKFKEVIKESVDPLYVDLSLFKKIGASSPIQIETIGSKIKVSIDIPGELINTNKKFIRQFKVYRLHDGVVEAINTTTYEKTFVIETDLFSEYAITYEDVKNPNTGESDFVEKALVVCIVLFVLCLSALIYVKKKNNKTIEL